MPVRSYACWNDGLPECEKGGRECCERYDVNAQIQMFDLHNLAPSIGQVNAIRSKKRYGVILGDELKLGGCDFEWRRNVVEPPGELRGEVARVWLYFTYRYGLLLLDGELDMYLKWSLEDPPDEWEIERNSRIKKVQGNGNPYIDDYYR